MNNRKEMTPTQIITARHRMSKDISTYNKTNIIRCACGVVCVVVGIATTPIPMTTIPLLLLGGVMMGYDMKALIRKVRYEVRLKKIMLLSRMVRDE